MFATSLENGQALGICKFILWLGQPWASHLLSTFQAHIWAWAYMALSSFQVPWLSFWLLQRIPKPSMVLTVLSPSQLGFSQLPTYDNSYDKVRNFFKLSL
jgi:hypothetical protein